MATFYIIYAPKIDRYYIGSCLDLELRLKQHREKHFESGFTHRATDWELFFAVEKLDQKTARAIENHVKKMKSRKYLANLKLYPEIMEKLIAKYAAGSSR